MVLELPRLLALQNFLYHLFRKFLLRLQHYWGRTFARIPILDLVRERHDVFVGNGGPLVFHSLGHEGVLDALLLE